MDIKIIDNKIYAPLEIWSSYKIEEEKALGDVIVDIDVFEIDNLQMLSKLKTNKEEFYYIRLKK
jgi:hypothetical protein